MIYTVEELRELREKTFGATTPGPTVKFQVRCNGCPHCINESYRCQSDSGTNVFCAHPTIGKKGVGDTNWSTPAWCPLRNESLLIACSQAAPNLLSTALALTERITELEKARYPSELSDPLRDVLGLMNFDTVPIAHLMRDDGRNIPRKCEEEQAVVLHWLIGIVLEHGTEWRAIASAELEAMKSRVAALTSVKSTEGGS